MSIFVWLIAFQFAHPVWGETGKWLLSYVRVTFQFAHPVWGETAKILYVVPRCSLTTFHGAEGVKLVLIFRCLLMVRARL